MLNVKRLIPIETHQLGEFDKAELNRHCEVPAETGMNQH